MSLDLSKLIDQIVDLVTNLKSKEAGRQAKLDYALRTLASSSMDLDTLKQKVAQSKTTWLVPGIKENIDLRLTSPSCPDDLIVLGSDGSHVDVDRHQAAHCFLINIGTAELRYGKNPDARLLNFPSLYFRDVDVNITSEDGRQVPIEGQLLGIKRSIEECRILVEKAGELEADLPVVMLLDGSLIFWRLAEQIYQDFVICELLEKGFLKYLAQLKDISRRRQLAVASYISYPRSTDVVNLLRLAVCPHPVVDCDRYCSAKFSARECDNLSGLLDRELFHRLLAPGERSAVFSSRSSVVTKYYGASEVNFFYIRLDREVGRVEVPLWVAEDERRLGLVHGTILNQCRLGLGYPIALSEAHEQAVISAADREQFWRMVEQVMIEDGIFPISSAKSESKRVRWI
jgi:hypothetical protein